MLAVIERCQTTQGITACCLWGCVAADQLECPDSPLMGLRSCRPVTVPRLAPVQCLLWACGRRNWTLEQWEKVAWSDESRFLLQHVAGQVRVRDGSRMHCGKKASWWRQCDALGNILLGNLGSWHSRGCYLDTYHLPKHCCRPRTPRDGKGIP